MPQITVIDKNGRNHAVEAESGWSLMEILRDKGFDAIEGACGGSMACATCHLYIDPNWQQKVTAEDNEKTEEEDDILDLAFDVIDASRLSCQVRMSDALDGLIVALPGAKVDW